MNDLKTVDDQFIKTIDNLIYNQENKPRYFVDDNKLCDMFSGKCVDISNSFKELLSNSTMIKK